MRMQGQGTQTSNSKIAHRYIERTLAKSNIVIPVNIRGRFLWSKGRSSNGVQFQSFTRWPLLELSARLLLTDALSALLWRFLTLFVTLPFKDALKYDFDDAQLFEYCAKLYELAMLALLDRSSTMGSTIAVLADDVAWRKILSASRAQAHFLPMRAFFIYLRILAVCFLQYCLLFCCYFYFNIFFFIIVGCAVSIFLFFNFKLLFFQVIIPILILVASPWTKRKYTLKNSKF